ncbi:MAG: 2-amino-4-hydroxy-6-hydroxymethyldihydropteridine diphosphokinase, partial [Bryobacteraceae bacterium]|nr:2-amino-4-hydroxy-6-hydroxymethyldihydropteridine diphosphokinase [Bryobacteraceae bacterium]
LGDRGAHLQEAVQQLHGENFQVTKVSGVYENPPMYVEDQPSFFNIAVEAETSLPALAVLERAAEIEVGTGRVRVIRNGPRVIDIDVVLYGDEVIATPRLTVPHPRMNERRFVLQPLAEIAPGLRHPVSGKSVEELLAAVSDQLCRRDAFRLSIPRMPGKE